MPQTHCIAHDLVHIQWNDTPDRSSTHPQIGEFQPSKVHQGSVQDDRHVRFFTVSVSRFYPVGARTSRKTFFDNPGHAGRELASLTNSGGWCA